MKHIVYLFAFLLIQGVCSCNGSLNNNQEGNRDSLGLCDTVLMKYVKCPRDTVARLLAIGDSVNARPDRYTLEDLGLCDKNHNERLESLYGDTIQAIVSIYDSYDKITSCGDADEISAAFVWHEVAKAQISHFLGKGEDADLDKFLCTVKGLLDRCDGGSQGEMTTAAYRLVLVADYRLLDAYKQLMDCFPMQKVKDLVHEDYRFLLDASRCFFKNQYEKYYYSDLSRELMCIFYQILTSRTASINRLLEHNASKGEVEQNLSEHTCIVDGKTFRFTADKISTYYSVY